MRPFARPAARPGIDARFDAVNVEPFTGVRARDRAAPVFFWLDMPLDPDAIDDVIQQTAEAGVQRVQVGNQSVEALSVTDLLKARDAAASDTAATKPHFGLRFTKLIPPGCG